MERPRLAEHVAVRKHVIEGTTVVVLHDTSRAQLARIGEREWGLLSCADGTRDLEGIVAAAVRRGWAAQVSHLRVFFGELERAGMLREGVAPWPETGPEPPPAERPVVPLPGYQFRCGGQGSCCRIFPTTLVSPQEVARARVVAPEVLDVGACAAAAFTPERGSLPLEQGPATVARVDGCCAFLSGSSGCTLHQRAGAEAKPLGCRQFPVMLVDDGRAVQASLVPECACVFDSLDDPQGEPLFAPAIHRAGDLDAAVHIRRVPDRIALTPKRSISRDSYLAHTEVWMSVVDGIDDVARWMWALAAALEVGRDTPVGGEEPIAAAEVTSRFQNLGRVVGRRVDQDVEWRHPRDLARQVPRWLLEAVQLCSEEGADFESRDQRSVELERLYLRLVIHGHQWLEDDGLCEVLRSRAVRLWLARKLSVLIAADKDWADDSAMGQPIALVEAACRGFGLTP